MISARQHNNALTYDYIVGGVKKKRYQVIDMILDFLKDDNKTTPEIVNHIQMEEQQCRNLLRFMINANFISNTGKKRGDHFLYETYRECELSKLFGYTQEAINKKFKIKSRKVRKIEDAPNVSYRSKLRDVAYTNHHLNSIYYADGD